MSRPPRPLFRNATAGDGTAFAATRQFLPIEFAQMVALQKQLAEEEAKLGVTEEDGDFAYTLLELSALVGHTLGLYQNLYAREAYIGAAETSKSLVFHARRLAYEPDRGLAASGYAVLTIGKGLKGTLPAGFAIASSPRGEIKAQTYETLDDLQVDAARNVAFPVARTRPAQLTFNGRVASFRLAGTGLPLATNEFGILVRDSDDTWEPVTIISLTEDVAANETSVEIELLENSAPLVNNTEALSDANGDPTFRLLAIPKERLQRFGWNADPIQFPPSQLKTKAAYASNPANTVANPDYGYQVTLDTGSTSVNNNHVYLSADTKTNLLSQLVAVRSGSEFKAAIVATQGSASVAFRRGEEIEFQVGVIDGNGDPKMETQTQLIETQISGAVTYLRLEASNGASIARSTLPMTSPILANWQFEAPVLGTEPNPAVVTAPLELDANFGDFRPGGYAVFESLDGAAQQVIEIQSLTITPEGTTEIGWAPINDPPASGWTLNNLQVFGNVARITHGESIEEILGGSDGITPFLTFELKKAPVTQVPGGSGGKPAIDVRVNEVSWTLVEDFFHSGSEDRHYRLETDEKQKVSVIFGNGRNGAIPPSGKKHITAAYRQGLGANGNTDAGSVSRIKKAHPLIERVLNPSPLLGGADPAGLTDLKRQATRFIRTFDRAVSVQDHADLALLYPGVARASARTAQAGIEVVVATADGSAPVLADVEAFLDARRDTNLPMTVVGPDPIDFYLDVLVEHDPAYLTENIKRAVQDALLGLDPLNPGMFTFVARDFGQAAHLSEIYDRIADVQGVTFVDVTRFRIGNAAGVKDLLRVNARQWLRLPPSNLNLSAVPGVVV